MLSKCLLIIVLIEIDLINSNPCFWNNKCPYQGFLTRTPYDVFREDIRDSVVRIKGCTPISIWGLFRHGKRFPGNSYAQKMEEAVLLMDDAINNFTGTLCAQDVENLRNWEHDSELFKNAHHLDPIGMMENQDLGKRLLETFPQLLENMKPDSYVFRPAEGFYMEQAAQSFVRGLNNLNYTIENPVQSSDIMAPYQLCRRYKAEVRNNPDTYEEATKYTASREYKMTKLSIQNRLGLNYSLSDDNVRGFHDLCAYTWTRSNKTPWCALFDTHDLEVLEYEGDLRTYYRDGYGIPSNLIYGKIGLADMYRSFQDVTIGKGKVMYGYMTHATMMEMVYSALGLFKNDVPLTHEVRNMKRKWRSSIHTTYGANLFAVLTRCVNQNISDYKVIFYHNESPLTYLCDDGVCSWEEFEELFLPFLEYNLGSLNCHAVQVNKSLY